MNLGHRYKSQKGQGAIKHYANSVLNEKAIVDAFNQEKALIGVFFVITNLRMELFETLVGEGRGIGGRWKCCSCLQLVARNSAADTPERCTGRLHITVITLTTHQLHVGRQRRLLPTPGRGKFRVNRFVDKGLLDAQFWAFLFFLYPPIRFWNLHYSRIP